MTAASRLCPACGAAEPVQEGERIWPAGWTCPSCDAAIPVRDAFPLFAPALADTMTGMDPEHFSFLAEAEQGHFWFVPRNRLIVQLINRYFPTAENLLEIGCGTGMVLSALAQARSWRRLAGSELHPTGLKTARERLRDRAELVQMDAREIPAEQMFDVIGAFDVIEHIEEDGAVLRAIHRALRDRGGIVIAAPQHPWLWSVADDLAHHVRRYRRGELERKIEDAGFRIEFSGSYNSLLLPLMAASRLFERFTNRNGGCAGPAGVSAVQAEFALPRLLNGVFKAVVQLEVTLTLAGAKFPAGGSRVVVASKNGMRA